MLIVWLRYSLWKSRAQCLEEEQPCQAVTKGQHWAEDAGATLPDLPAFDAGPPSKQLEQPFYYPRNPPHASSSAFYRHRHSLEELEPAVVWLWDNESSSAEASIPFQEEVALMESHCTCASLQSWCSRACCVYYDVCPAPLQSVCMADTFPTQCRPWCSSESTAIRCRVAALCGSETSAERWCTLLRLMEMG